MASKLSRARTRERVPFALDFSRYPLLRFSKTRELWSSKAAFTSTFFAAVNHNYDHKQRTLKHRKTQNESKSTNYQSQTMTFWTRWGKLLFPKRFAKLIYGSEKRKLQLAFELNLKIRVSVFMKSAVNRELVCRLLVRPLYASNSVRLLKRYLP